MRRVRAETAGVEDREEGVIHQLLHLDKPLFVLDIEATSLDVKTARIVEIAFQKWESVSDAAKATGHDGMTKEWSSRINPCVPIPTAASKIHGIFDADVVGKPTFKQLAANLAKGFSDCSFAGQNCRYDLQVITAEMQRAGVEWSYIGARIIDSYQLERLAVPRSLSHLHEKYAGAKHDGAHGALSDVRAAATVIVKQLEAHESLPRDIDKLHEMSWPGWIDGDGKFKFVDGVPCFSGWGKYASRPMKDADAGYWKFIIAKDFSPDVKELAHEALEGRFPEAR